MKSWFPKLIFFILLTCCFIPLSAGADSIKIENPFGPDSTIWTILDKIINGIFYLSLPIGAIMIVIAAFHLLTSAGDPAKVSTAKSIILWTIVGIIVIFLSKALVALFIRILEGSAPSPPANQPPPGPLDKYMGW